MSRKRPTQDQLGAAIMEGTFGRSRDLRLVDSVEPGQLPAPVPITSIREYEHNPRIERNQKFEEIKEAIRSGRGLDQQLTVTRRPGDEQYILYAGGNTRLRILKELYEETQDEVFFYAACYFKPYTSEFDLMVAHAAENENRADLLWIDKARHVKQLRDAFEAQTGKQATQEELSKAITAHRWRVSQETISRLEYTYDTLLPAIPNALCAGIGAPQMRKIRQLQKSIDKYLQFRAQPKEQLEGAKQWFIECMACHDTEDWDIEPVIRDAVDRLAEICHEPTARVRLELEAFMRGSEPTPATTESTSSPDEQGLGHEPLPPNKPSDAAHRGVSRRDTKGERDAAVDSTEAETEESRITLGRSTEAVSKAGLEKDVESHDVEFGATAEREELTAEPLVTHTVSEHKTVLSAKDLRARSWTLATRLAQRNQIGECIYHIDFAGGFIIDLPESPLYVDSSHPTRDEYKRVDLWWFLAGVADQFLNKYAGRLIEVLPETARLSPLLQRMNSDDDEDKRSAQNAMTTYVSKPPTLDSVLRHLMGHLDDIEFKAVVSLIDVRRQFQTLCDQEGKEDLWEV
jgi:ParB family protein of integrating conjugative element (PFGI_1 class)